MKKVLFLLFATFAIAGCGGDDEKKEELTIGTIYDGYKIEENITPIGGGIDQTDITKYIIVGMTEKGVWVGNFDRESKNMLSQKICSTSFPTTATIKLGNDDSKTYRIDSFQSPVVKKIHGNILFTLYGSNNTANVMSAYLCKIENGEFYVKEYTSVGYSIQNIYEWFDNTYYVLTSAPKSKQYVIDDKFNEKFETYADYSAFPRAYIDEQNIIYFNKGEIIRTNVKDDEWLLNVWTTHLIDANAEVSNCKLSINGVVLTFTCDYVQNGSKGTLSKTIDINTGKITS